MDACRIAETAGEPTQELNEPSPGHQTEIHFPDSGQAIRHVPVQAGLRFGEAVQQGRTETRRLIQPPIDHGLVPILGCMLKCDGFLNAAGCPTAVGGKPVDVHCQILRVRVASEAGLRQTGKRSVGAGVGCGNIPRRECGPSAARKCPDRGLGLQLPQQSLPELFPNVLQRFDRLARSLRHAQASLNSSQVHDGGDVTTCIAHGGVRADRTFRREQLGRPANRILRILGSCGVAVPEQPVPRQLDECIRQFRSS